MSQTSIEWCDSVWNPVRGCSRVSPGCDNCYAMRQAHRFAGPGGPYEGLTTLRRGKVDWLGKARFVPEQLKLPLRWRKPKRIFVNSMSDLFHESLTNEQIAAVFGVMAACPQHTFQVLTKRPKCMREWFARDVDHATDCGEAANRLLGGSSYFYGAGGRWPLPNVWLGVSAEDQQRANERIPSLLETPAEVRFISAEPLLGPIDLSAFLLPHGLLSWCIVGGESGRAARYCQVEWVTSITKQCAAARTACFVKQLGTSCWTDIGERLVLEHSKGGDWNEWPNDLRIREFPTQRVVA